MTLPGEDTIAAIATPAGRGGVGILRLSGPATRNILASVCGQIPSPRYASLTHFCNRNDPETTRTIDQGIALFFPAPASYTGEDVAELHAHGSPVVLNELLTAVLGCGARLAEPGEFSKRAYLNGKLDLAQAEAVADLIASTNIASARAARRSLDGEFSRRVRAMSEQMVALRTFVEASIDFADEALDLLHDDAVIERITVLRESMTRMRNTARQGVLLRDGISLVIAGKPNAGKSSLLNRLSGRDSAIVADEPGTTRDLIRELIDIDGLVVQCTDTAGLRAESNTIEREGIRRARNEIERADHLLLVLDSTHDHSAERVLAELFDADTPLPPLTVILNKCDLSNIAPGRQSNSTIPTIAVSALTGAGFDALRQRIADAVDFQPPGDGDCSARTRHLDALDRAAASLREGLAVFEAQQALELLAEHLRTAHAALGEITGEFTTDDLLGQIFASFCIGK